MIDTITSAFINFWTSVESVIKSFKFPRDLIDVLVVAYIIYHGIRLVRETRAMQLLKGIIAILVVWFVADKLEMITLGFFTRNIIGVGIFVLAVLFQPELRSALEKMGRSSGNLMSIGGGGSINERKTREIEDLIEILVDSCKYLSSTKTGALIIIEKDTKLGDVIKTGTLIDANPSMELICNIFFHNSPLHDGAMVIRDCRIHAAGCYLPLSQNMEIGRELGTRHRAALGMSEVSDAVVLVVSEETGAITIANESKLQRKLSDNNLRKLLEIKLLGASAGGEEAPGKKIGFWKVKK